MERALIAPQLFEWRVDDRVRHDKLQSLLNSLTSLGWTPVRLLPAGRAPGADQPWVTVVSRRPRTAAPREGTK